MKVSPQLEAIFDYLYDSIRKRANREVNVIRAVESVLVPSELRGHTKSREVLATYLTSDEAIDALKRMLELFGQFVINDVMSLFDGEDADGYTYGLTDRETGEDLYPGCGYFDGWSYFAYVRDENTKE